MNKWLNNKFLGLMLALHKTEANLKVGDDDLIHSTGKFQSHKQGMLSHSLINGELTEEVKDLRWRIYKIMESSEGVNISDYDAKGIPIVSKSIKSIGKAKGDPTEELPLLMVVDNKPLGLGVTTAMAETKDEENYSFDDFLTKFKTQHSIFIMREGQSQFHIEKYTKKLFIKQTEVEEEVLLEFFVSQYPNLEDRRSRFFLSEIEKIKKGKRLSAVTDFQSIMFVSNKTAGVKDNLGYEFEIKKFKGISNYDGCHIIKFIAKKTIYGTDILEIYKQELLEEKYDKKEKKVSQ